MINFLKTVIKNLMRLTASVFDFILIPFNIFMIFWLKLARKTRFKYQKRTKDLLFKIGVFPIIDHYYEPLFNPKYLYKSLREDRNLPAIDFNVKEQLSLLNKFNYQNELLSFPRKKTANKFEFSYDYGAYPSGDSELYYSVIRTIKPKKIIEIGAGSSTLMALNAINKNKDENKEYECEIICVEPYEYEWLEQLGIKIIRDRVEKTSIELFQNLGQKDILFIDSSHIIRPQGDVLFEILEILPSLRKGVYVHFHDICTPKDYFDEWILNQVFWNEQYLLEAFLSFNKDFKIVLASNYLFHHHREILLDKCPIFKDDLINNPIREVGSFWIQRI